MHRTLLALLVLSITACDDPAPVGIDLVDQQTGEPYLLTTPATALGTRPAIETTGNATSALFGIVDDPDIGSLEAVAYLDFVAGARSSAFESGTVASARLLLTTNYVYGDSLSDITVQVRSIVGPWLGSGAKSDTSLAVGSLVTEAVVNYKTGTLEIPLPPEWVTQWDAALRGTTFDDDFHGFEISMASRTSILGVAVLGSAIGAVAAGDSVFYSAGRSLTRFVNPEPPPTSSGGIIFQDGRTQAGSFILTPGDLQRDQVVLNRGIIRVPVDTSLSATAPAGFARPPVDRLQLDWISADGTRTAISVADRFKDRFSFESQQLHDSLGVFVRGRGGLDHLEVRVPDANNSVSVIRLLESPTALMTVTPIQ